MNSMIANITRLEIQPGVYRYSMDESADGPAHTFIERGKKLYTHVAWFSKIDQHGDEIVCFQMCGSEEAARRASKSRWQRAGVREVNEPVQHAPQPNVELGRKLYAAMGWR